MPTPTTHRKALVIGANGGIGQATAQALLAHGWLVHALVRSVPPDADPAITWHRGDAMQSADVLRAAADAGVIVHAVNPPGYRDWDRLVLPMIDHSIAAARAVDARLVLPGTIYNYGPDAFPLLHEDAPQHPPSRKGAIRVELERRLQAATADGVRSLILRCGDFLAPHMRNNWFGQGIVKPGAPVRTLRYPGAPDHRHAWAYLPDVAETLARLLAREDELPDFARFHFAGWFIDGRELAAVVTAATGRRVRLGRFPWWLTALAAPFNQTVRELRDMRYLWRVPVALDGRAVQAFLGEVPATPPDQAMRATLDGLHAL